MKAMVWKQMDDSALRFECDRCGAPLDDIPQHVSGGVTRLCSKAPDPLDPARPDSKIL